MSRLITGTSGSDQLDLSQYAGYGPGPRGNWELQGLDGDDTLYAFIVSSFESHSLNGGKGNDFLAISFADGSANAGIGLFGDLGIDTIYYPGTMPAIVSTSTSGGLVQLTLTNNRTLLISPTTEIFSFGESSSTTYYLVEDLVRGEVRDASWDEVYFRAYQNPGSWLTGTNTRDLYLKKTTGSSTSLSLKDSLLVNKYLYEALGSYLQGSEVVTYYIHDQDSREIVDGFYTDTYYHSDAEENAIVSAFNYLDPLIDLDFRRVYSNESSTIDIYCVDQIQGFDDQVIGLTSPLEGWYDVQWKELSMSESLSHDEQVTIIHELGHALGLSHPNNKPSDPRYTTADTIMSYNTNYAVPYPTFTATDIAALQAIWGLENDGSSAQAPATSPAMSTAATIRVERSGAQAVDRITNFTAGRGTITIDPDLFGYDPSFRSVNSAKQLKKAQKSSVDLVYFQPRGELYCNDNLSQKGWGGIGLIAVIEGGPALNAETFVLA